MIQAEAVENNRKSIRLSDKRNGFIENKNIMEDPLSLRFLMIA